MKERPDYRDAPSAASCSRTCSQAASISLSLKPLPLSALRTDSSTGIALDLGNPTSAAGNGAISGSRVEAAPGPFSPSARASPWSR